MKRARSNTPEPGKITNGATQIVSGLIGIEYHSAPSKHNGDKQEIWTMTPEQSAGLKALHESIGLVTKDDTPESFAEPRPAVGSDEWLKRRRESHKLVERRRRGAINEGINEIASLVPGCEKNKGSILNNAVSYIKQLKKQEEAMSNKTSLKQIMMEREINHLKQHVELLKGQKETLADHVKNFSDELKKTRTENAYLKERLQALEHGGLNKSK